MSIERGRSIATIHYPLTTQCPVRDERSRKLTGQPVIDEHLYIRNAKPAFDGHDQPKLYGLGRYINSLDYTTLTSWDDAEEPVMRRHMELMQGVGINTVFFTSYAGLKRYGSSTLFQTELDGPMDLFAKLQPGFSEMRFAPIFSLFSPRVLLPFPANGSDEEITGYREYLLSADSLLQIVDNYLDKYLESSACFRFEGKPVISFFEIIKSALIHHPDFGINNLKKALDQVRDVIFKKYGTELFLVATINNMKDAKPAEEAGFDAVSNYAFLADFSKVSQHPIQNYDEQVEIRFRDWHLIRDSLRRIPYIPTAVQGWDAWARGEQVPFEKVIGHYPHAPIVVGSSAKKFRIMLERAMQFTKEHVKPEERFLDGIISCWNEMGEGNAILPRIRVENGEVVSIDDSYLQETANVIQESLL